MLESIEKLRTAGRNMAKNRNLEEHEECNLLLCIANEIEAEISERYTLLPVDADGVPWAKDDNVFVDESGNIHNIRRLAWNPNVKQWYLLEDNHSSSYLAKKCRHVKERTVEDILRDMISMTDQPLCEEDIQAFADEIRELLGSNASK